MVLHVLKLEVDPTVVAFHIHHLFVRIFFQNLELAPTRASLVEQYVGTMLVQLAYICEDVGLDSKVVVSTVIEAIVAEDPKSFALRYRDTIKIHHLMVQFGLLWLSQRANRSLVRKRIYLEFRRLFSETIVLDVHGDLITDIQGRIILRLWQQIELTHQLLALFLFEKRRVRRLHAQPARASRVLLLFLYSIGLNEVLRY